MMKFLVVVGVVALVLWLMLGRRRSVPRKPSPTSQPMVRCAHCGVHVPKTEALVRGERAFCSTAHLEAGVRNT